LACSGRHGTILTGAPGVFGEQFHGRHVRRTPNPGVVVENAGKQNWWPTHRDLAAWQVQIFDAIGTRSTAACWTFLNQLAEPNYGPNGCAPSSADYHQDDGAGPDHQTSHQK
jgi:hypothetical protein